MDTQKQAQQAFRNRDFATAEQLLLECLEQQPEDAIILMRLGQVHMAQGNFEESFTFLRRSQREDPQNPDVYRSLGMAIRMSGLIDLGISYLGIMLTYAPLVLQPQVHLTLAELFAVKGDSISLKSSLLLLEELSHTEDPRMELRLWCELNDSAGMLRFAKRHPVLADLVHGLLHEVSNPALAAEFFQKESCAEFWEADLGLYRLNGTFGHLENAFKKASKTAEVIVHLAEYEQQVDTLKKLSLSPVVFYSVRVKAQKILENLQL